MIPTKIWVGVTFLALVGCKGEEKPEMANAADVFPLLPLPPEPTIVAREGSPEALKLTLRSPAKPQVVEAYYRQLLSKNGWRLVSDSRDSEGAVVFLAQQEGPPLWVRILGTADGAATIVELAGAVVPQENKATKPAS
jgi:hypothetical protein